MKGSISNACTIFSIRELLEDPSWGPEELGRLILMQNGLPSEKAKELELYAPIKVWEPVQIRGNNKFIEISDGKEKQILQGSQRMVIAYQTEEKRGHMECILVKDIGIYVQKQVLFVLTKRDDVMDGEKEGALIEAILSNDITILAIRELLEDSSWGPEELGHLILMHKGLPSEKAKELELYAPIKVWELAQIQGSNGRIEISDGKEKQILQGSQRMVIAYQTEEKRGYSECILVKDIGTYAQKQVIFSITRRDFIQEEKN